MSAFVVAAARTIRRRTVLMTGVAFSGFFVLGAAAGLIGVAWPSIMATFSLPLDSLGLLLGASTLGYILSSLNVGRIIARAGLGPVLAASALVSAAGLIGYALSPGWGSMLLAAVVAGVGAASIDVGLNTYMAGRSDPRLMNWLHASAGVGISLGPALMTTAITSAHSWRYGYAAGSLLPLALALVFLLTRGQWQPARAEPVAARRAQGADAPASCYPLDRWAPWLAIGMAFVYAGVEKTAGQWSFSLLTQSRSVGPGVAGMWMSVFWASFTLGRVLTGFVLGRVPAYRILRGSMAGLVLGATAVSLRVSLPLSLIGLALLGAALAPIYPLLMTSTSRRVGPSRVAHAVGFQVSAASLGSAAVPALVGVLAQSQGLEVIGPVMLALSLVLSVLCERVICRQF